MEGELKLKFSFKKWGNGSSCYSVSLLTDYNGIVKREIYTPLGIVKKKGDYWIGTTKEDTVEGRTRKEAAENLVKLIKGK